MASQVQRQNRLEDTLVTGYTPLEDAYDEAFAAPGTLRKHSASVLQAFGRLSADEVRRRWERAQRQIRDNGVTYNVYDDSRGLDRPWQLDPAPLALPDAEWRTLEAGLAQRARLLELVLRDIYGRQSLLRSGVVPPAVVFANPAFLRPCHVAPGGKQWRFLQLYAADVCRVPDGRFRVLGDRTQAPSGMGYALENRIVLSRAFPGVFRDCRVERLAPFFRTLLDTLNELSPRKREQPLVLLLTPGPLNETYFEHAYLARYLGLPLVEGGDLTVRKRVVYLKTLSGLRRVDVILRRLDDLYCDPLTLRSDSALGVAGLVSAVRAGNVAVANSLGSGVVESPALATYLPALCRHLLGEELMIDGVEGRWCGEPGAVDDVEQRFEQLVIKPAFRTPGVEPVFGAMLSADERAALLARIRARPFEWVAQERLTLGTAPCWEDGHVSPRPVTMRSYLVNDGADYRAMNGGLTRAAADSDFIVSMQRGANSKDTWVLSDGPVSQLSLLGRTSQHVELSRSGDDLPSRVADNFFWLGRYVERAEGASRLLRNILSRLTDEVAASDVPELQTLCKALSAQTQIALRGDLVRDDEGLARLEVELVALAQTRQKPHTLLASMEGGHRAAAALRDRVSADTWRVLTQLRRHQKALEAPGLGLSEALDVLDQVVLTLAALSGLQMESLSRTQAFRFIDMGRRLERAKNTAQLLRTALVGVNSEEAAILSAVLEVLDNAITYRRRYQGLMQLAPVLDLLLTDEANPRSVAFQLAALDEHVRQLPRAQERPFRTRPERIVLQALTRVRLADIDALCEPAADGSRPVLDAHLEELMRDLPVFSDALTEAYLAHAIPQQSFGPGAPR